MTPSDPQGSQSAIGSAYCPRCKTGYRLTQENLGHRSICVKCGQYFHLLPDSGAADTRWEDTTAALNELASRVWERGLDLRVGQVILGVYAVQEILGKGGLGRVFKVRHRDWRRELALKLPYRSVMEPEYFKSLKNEAETWVALGLHPHVVTCYYVRPLMGVPAIFMEHVQGGSLKELMDPDPDGAPPPLFRGDASERTLRFLDLSIQAAWGLAHAHARGVLHLDIKPQNLLLEEDTGRLLVTDFGLARAARETENPSDSASLWPGDLKNPSAYGSALGPPAPGAPGPAPAAAAAPPERGGFGTPQYMSPEAARKLPPDAGFDLWSLSLTILELFLGSRPWEYGGAAGEALEQYAARGKTLTPFPDGVLALLRKALDRDPARRFLTAAEIARELARIYKETSGRDYPRDEPRAAPDSADNLNNRAVSMVDLGQSDKAEALWRKALREDPGHILSFFNLALHRYRRKSLSPEAFQGSLDDLVRLSSGGRHPDLPLIMCGAYLELGLVAEAAAALDSYAGPSLNHEARRLKEILERGRLNPEQAERMRPAIYRISRVGDPPEGSRDALKTAEPLLKEARRLISEKTPLLALEPLLEARRQREALGLPEFREAWSALYSVCDRPELLDADEDQAADSGPGGALSARAGDFLAVADRGSVSFVKNFPGPQKTAREARLASPPEALALSRDGRMAAALTQDGHLWLFDPENAAGLGQAQAHPGPARALAFSVCGRRLFTGDDSGEFKMWDTRHGYLDKGTPLLVKRLSQRPLARITPLLNGRQVSVLSLEAEYRLTLEKIAGPVKSFPLAFPSGPPYGFLDLAMDPFNRYLVSSWREGVVFHQLFDTDWRPDLSALEGTAAALAVSPDARLWAAATVDGRLFLGRAPQREDPSFKVLKTLSAAEARFLDFTSDHAGLVAVGPPGIRLFRLDWALEPPLARGWDRTAEQTLGNFLARNPALAYSEKALADFKSELSRAGHPAMDPFILARRLQDALGRWNPPF
jgi:serine/threonine protein kinase